MLRQNWKVLGLLGFLVGAQGWSLYDRLSQGKAPQWPIAAANASLLASLVRREERE